MGTHLAKMKPTLEGLTTAAMSERGTDELLLYYGQSYPCLEAAEHYEGMVVLQPYHPIVTGSQYAQIFPNAQRYLYYNPVKTWGKPEMLTFAADGENPLPSAIVQGGAAADFDLGSWLAVERNLEKAKLAEAGQLMDIPGVVGLFVDDIDHWLVEECRFAPGLAMLQRIANAARGRLILNRGFRFWPKLSSIDAVVLENLGPHDIAKLACPSRVQDLRWLHHELSQFLPALKPAKASGSAMAETIAETMAETFTDQPGAEPEDKAVTRPKAVAVFALSYLHHAPKLPEGVCHEPAEQMLFQSLGDLLNRSVVSQMVCDRALDVWPEAFQPLP